ncbi:MAG: CpaE family protein [Cumulibacter sp.]
MAAIGIVTAIANPALEAVVIRALGEATEDLEVVRRCVEVTDVLAVAASGRARAVVVGDDLAGLDADVVSRIIAHGVVPIALVEPDRAWPTASFFPVVLDTTADSAELARQIALAARAGVRAADLPAPATHQHLTQHAGHRPGSARGRVIAIWGSNGAPGRSTVALGLADEVARLDVPALLIDADPYGGSQAAMLGLLDESPGIAAACRAAANGTLDTATLVRLCLQLSPRLRVLTGISRSDRWPELRPSAIEILLEQARSLARVTVVDCGFCIEEDEEITYDTLAPRRNGATTTVLQGADEVLLVVGCDPVSVARGVRAVQELRELSASISVRVIANRVRASVLAGNPSDQLNEAFGRFAGVRVEHLLPMDTKACDTALQRGRTLADVAGSSALRRSLGVLAQVFVPTADAPRVRRRGHARR